MTEQNALVTDFAKCLLSINIEASIRCGKAETGALTAYHALAGNAAWAAYRLLVTLNGEAPDVLAELLPELIEELSDGEYMEDADDIAEQLGVDVTDLADRVRAEYEQPAAQTAMCKMPHPVADHARCGLPAGHDGWHAADVGAWPDSQLPFAARTSQPAQES